MKQTPGSFDVDVSELENLQTFHANSEASWALHVTLVYNVCHVSL
jgi:hypothetical protein